MGVCRAAELVSQLEERERTSEATIQGLDKELLLQQQVTESHHKKTDDSLQELTQIKLLLVEKQRLVDGVQQNLSNRTDECEKETQLHKRQMLSCLVLGVIYCCHGFTGAWRK